jgi:hypothetical protein
MNNTETWHVAITLADDGFDVTAKARFADCGVDLVGLGVEPVGPGQRTGRASQAMAAMRALESLAAALGQAARADLPAPDHQV